MTQHLTFLLLGLGNGAAYAILGSTLVVVYRSSGVVNLGSGAVAMYAAFTYAELREHGNYFNPIPGLDPTIELGQPASLGVALAATLLTAAALSALLYACVFRPLRAAPAVARLVASVGVMVLLQSLIGVRLGTEPVTVQRIFPSGSFRLAAINVPYDRLWFATTVVLTVAALGAMYRFSRFGLETRANAESEKGAIVSGLSPVRIAILNWALAGALAGLAGVMIAPLMPLVPNSYTLLVIPALAAALSGRLTALVPTATAGFLLGMVQSEIGLLQTRDWYPSVLGTAASDALPLVIVVGFLVLRGTTLPTRGALALDSLPLAGRPRRIGAWAGVLAALASVALLTTGGGYRAAVITSLVMIVLALSGVVITGFVGQVSLAQLTLAGLSALMLSRLTTDLGVPFPIAPLLAASVSAAVGVVIGAPALRVRGVTLAIVTIATAVAVDALYFRNSALNGGLFGGRVETPSLASLDLGIGSGGAYPRVAFGFTVLVFAVACGVFVANLRRSRLGGYMLAVRANERAAAASGINVTLVKVIGFAVASFLAGLAGALIGYQQTHVSGESFTVLASVALFATFYLAGVTSISGAVLGGLLAPNALVYTVIDRRLGVGAYYDVVIGVVLIATVMRFPGGLASAIQHLGKSARHHAPGQTVVRAAIPVSVSSAGGQ